MQLREHWESVHSSKATEQTSWYQPHLRTSLEWITRVAPARNASIIDIAPAALDRSRARLVALPVAEAASHVRWLAADIAQPDLALDALPPAAYDLWHDRAVFHFLTEPAQRQAYIARLAASIRPSGHTILATFGPDGPQKCSGLPTMRYSAPSLSARTRPAIHPPVQHPHRPHHPHRSHPAIPLLRLPPRLTTPATLIP